MTYDELYAAFINWINSLTGNEQFSVQTEDSWFYAEAVSVPEPGTFELVMAGLIVALLIRVVFSLRKK